jgi:hypothetical protein
MLLFSGSWVSSIVETRESWQHGTEREMQVVLNNASHGILCPAEIASCATEVNVTSKYRPSLTKTLSRYSLTLLAPVEGCRYALSTRPSYRCNEYEQALAEVQQLRGRVAAAEGVNPSMLDASGKLVHPADRLSWIVVMRAEDAGVSGTLRVTVHRPECVVDDLDTVSSLVFVDAAWKLRGRKMLFRFLQRARAAQVCVAESGGWVLEKSIRGGMKGTLLALSGLALMRLIGGAKILGVVTTKGGASRLAHYLGGVELRDNDGCMPPYFDDRYRSTMEFVEFDSDHVNPRFEAAVKNLSDYFSGISPLAPAQRLTL